MATPAPAQDKVTPEERIGEKGLPIPERVEEGDREDPNSWASGMVGVCVAGDGHFYREGTGVFVAGGASPNKAGMNGKNGKKIQTFKAALMDAFHEIGYDEFVEWGRANKTKFYQLCGKMIPLDVKIEASHKVLHVTMALPPPRLNGGAGQAPPVDGETRTQELSDGTKLTTTFTVPAGGIQEAELVEDVPDEASLIPAPPTARDKRETEWREDLSRRPPKEAPV